MKRGVLSFVVKPAVFTVMLLPAIYWLLQMVFSLNNMDNNLGTEPGKTLVLEMGMWSMIALFIVLLVSPLKQILHLRWLQQLRRMLGLFVLFYASLHVTAYLVFLVGLDWVEFISDLQERIYIIAGAPAFVGLMLLGITSNRWSMRKLRSNWGKLHKLVYVVGGLAVLHVFLQIRSDATEAIIYLVILSLLLGYRVWRAKINRLKVGR
jgi:sulfoxide reductase heme-binding subunit YedZ